jgi:hypothetical protein
MPFQHTNERGRDRTGVGHDQFDIAVGRHRRAQGLDLLSVGGNDRDDDGDEWSHRKARLKIPGLYRPRFF